MILQTIILFFIVKASFSWQYPIKGQWGTDLQSENIFTSTNYNKILDLFDLVQKKDNMSFALANTTDGIEQKTQVIKKYYNDTALKDLNITLLDFSQVNADKIYVFGEKKPTPSLKTTTSATVNATYSLSNCTIHAADLKVNCSSIDFTPIDTILQKENMSMQKVFGIQALTNQTDTNIYTGLSFINDKSIAYVAIVKCKYDKVLEACMYQKLEVKNAGTLEFNYLKLLYNPFTAYQELIFVPYQTQDNVFTVLFFDLQSLKVDTIKDTDQGNSFCGTGEIQDFKIQSEDLIYLTKHYLCRFTTDVKVVERLSNLETLGLYNGIQNTYNLTAEKYDVVIFDEIFFTPKAFDSMMGQDYTLLIMVYFEKTSYVQVYSWDKDLSNDSSNEYLELKTTLSAPESSILTIRTNCATTYCYFSSFIAVMIKSDTTYLLQVYENNLSHLYFGYEREGLIFQDSTNIQMKWSSESLLVYASDQTIGVIYVNSVPSIEANLTENTTVVLNYTDNTEGSTWNQVPINYFIYPEDTAFVSKYPAVNLTDFLSVQTTGRFIYESKIDLESWFMGNSQAFDYRCNNQTAIGASTIFTDGNIFPRKFNIYKKDLTQDAVFHYHNMRYFTGKSFLSIMQIKLIIYINLCSITRSGVVRCSLKGQIPESQTVLTSAFSSKIMAYKQQDAWYIYSLSPMEQIIVLHKPYSYCTISIANEYTLYCSDMALRKIFVYMINVENKNLYTIRVIDNIYASILRTSESFSGLLFGLSDTFISIIDVYNGQVLNTIQSELTMDNRYYIELLDTNLVVVCYSRNSFEEYYIGDIANPVKTLGETKFTDWGFHIINAHGQHVSRKDTNILPILVTDENNYQTLLYLKIGDCKFNKILFTKKLYEYRQFSTIFLQTTYLPPDDTRNQSLEIVSLIDSGANSRISDICQYQKTDIDMKGLPLACDLVVFHDYRSILDLREAEINKTYDCFLDVHKYGDTNIQLSANFTINVGGYSEVISDSEGETVKVEQSFSNDPIALQKYYTGMVLGYNLSQKSLRTKSKFTLTKLYEWDQQSSQIFNLTRNEFKVNSIVVNADDSILIQSEDMIIRMAMNKNSISSTTIKPTIKAYVHQKTAGEQTRKNCSKILYDNDSQLSFSFCYLKNSLVCVITSFNNRKVSILLEQGQTFSAYNSIIHISLMTTQTSSNNPNLESAEDLESSFLSQKTILVFSNKISSNEFEVNSWTMIFPNTIKNVEPTQRSNNVLQLEDMTADFVESVDTKDLQVKINDKIINANNLQIAVFNTQFKDQNKGNKIVDTQSKPTLYIYTIDVNNTSMSQTKLLSIELQELIKDNRYGFVGLINLRCEDKAFFYSKVDFEAKFGKDSDMKLTDQTQYFSCILVQSDMLHFEILFWVTNQQQIEYKIVSYYVQYTSFKAKNKNSISKKYFAITGERSFHIESSNFDYNENQTDQLPSIYLFTYERQTKLESQGTKYALAKSHYKTSYLSDPEHPMTQIDYDILEDFVAAELYSQLTLRDKPKSIQIEGGVSVDDRNGDSKMSIKFKNFMNDQYLIMSGFLHNPINFFKLNPIISVVSKDIYREDFIITAFNHFSNASVNIISENPLINTLKYILIALAGILLSLLLLCICVKKSRAKRTEKQQQIDKLKEGIDSDDDLQNQEALGALQEEDLHLSSDLQLDKHSNRPTERSKRSKRNIVIDHQSDSMSSITKQSDAKFKIAEPNDQKNVTSLKDILQPDKKKDASPFYSIFQENKQEKPSGDLIFHSFKYDSVEIEPEEE